MSGYPESVRLRHVKAVIAERDAALARAEAAEALIAESDTYLAANGFAALRAAGLVAVAAGDLRRTIAQLRHAYTQMQKYDIILDLSGFAKGQIAPQIEALERLLDPAPPAQEKSDG
ncbi:hypothetical protein GCM10008171_32370 [Methylopila jiangsuensis]|uniref:Uncharacterized protein n=1 Tax=Methylopila jiangsuensis TaxID=586230 RepID=A0A9W6N541_9HYPH|nr:hypothetical protein [Methylopila jiangsuensis]MDR6284628.1 putative membrane protein [Methylopila jiangsuensis]GLK77983.1 hypothetical protein GCM10008171_32370 [Methylopila jiangsuensis]